MELSHSEALWVRKFVYQCMQEILVLTKSSVPPTLHVSGCEIAYSSRHILSMFKCGTIGHPCYDQLKAVQKGCLLTSVTWGTQLSEIMYFLKSYPLTSFWFSIDRGLRSIFYSGIYFTFKMQKLNYRYLRKTFFIKRYNKSFALGLG